MAASVTTPSRPRLVIGIPSWNEAGTIERVAKDSDAALLFCQLNNCTIANADSGSEDGTRDRFSATSLHSHSVSIDTGRPGKGANFRALAELVVTQGYDGMVIVDADLAFVHPSWIEGLVKGLAAGYDAVFARRPPFWNRGDLTYHLCYPALAAIAGIRIREPIAPTQAYSRKLLQCAVSSNWDNHIEGYGIDFHMAALAANFNWTEVILPVRLEHKLRSFSPASDRLTRNSKFNDVLLTVRTEGLLARPLRHLAIERVLPAQERLAYGVVEPCEEYDRLTFKTELALTQALAERRFPESVAHGVRSALRIRGGYRGLDWATWRDALLLWIEADDPATMSEDLELLLLSRCAGFYNQCLGRRDWYDTVEGQTTDLLSTVLQREKAPVF
jgi:hypothetical protein